MFGTNIKGFAIITVALAVTTYVLVAILISSRFRKASHKMGQSIWQSIKGCATQRFKVVWKPKRKGRTVDQEQEVVSEVMDPEKAA